MKRIVLFSIIAMLVVGVALASGWYAGRSSEAGVPDSFEVDFSGTGLVEDSSFTADGCEIKVALYDWINLSAGFELAEIPQQNQRFVLRGEGEVCNALTVATTDTKGHISFEAGRAKDNWYFLAAPEAGVSCGGLAIDWEPEPES